MTDKGDHVMFEEDDDGEDVEEIEEPERLGGRLVPQETTKKLAVVVKDEVASAPPAPARTWGDVLLPWRWSWRAAPEMSPEEKRDAARVNQERTALEEAAQSWLDKKNVQTVNMWVTNIADMVNAYTEKERRLAADVQSMKRDPAVRRARALEKQKKTKKRTTKSAKKAQEGSAALGDDDAGSGSPPASLRDEEGPLDDTEYRRDEARVIADTTQQRRAYGHLAQLARNVFELLTNTSKGFSEQRYSGVFNDLVALQKETTCGERLAGEILQSLDIDAGKLTFGELKYVRRVVAKKVWLAVSNMTPTTQVTIASLAASKDDVREVYAQIGKGAPSFRDGEPIPSEIL